MDRFSNERKIAKRRIMAAIDAQNELSKLQQEARDLRERFRQWCREAEIGLRMLLDGGSPLALA